MKRKKKTPIHYRNVLFALFVVTLGLTGCKSTEPMTLRIDQLASKVGKIENFQYYVSRNIVLTKTEDTDIKGKVAVDGEINLTYNKDFIQITSATEGALLKTTVNEDGNKVYHVAFEADNDNCLRFVQKGYGKNEKIYLYYDDPESHAVLYGNDVYLVTWDGLESLNATKEKAKMDNWSSKLKGIFKGVKSDDEDSPHLLVKMNIKIKENEEYRKASGRKVIISE